MKNIIKLCKFNLFTSRKIIIGWTVAIGAIMILYMILFPSIQDMAQIKLDAMPKELLQFVGMENMADMGDYTTYYGMIFGLILVAVSIFSATFSAGLITKEEQTKSIEFLSSLPVSRMEIYTSKYFTSAIATTLILTAGILAAIICGLINGGETFTLGNIIMSAKTTSFTAFFFGGVALFLASLSQKTGSGSIVSMIVLASYMTGYLGEILGNKGEILQCFSPFISFSVKNSLEMDDRFIVSLGVYFAVYLACVIFGCKAYEKRDLKV